MLPFSLFFPDFGPDPDFFGETGPEMVRIGTQKSGLEGQKQRQTTLKAYFNNICRSRSDLAFVINILAIFLLCLSMVVVGGKTVHLLANLLKLRAQWKSPD